MRIATVARITHLIITKAVNMKNPKNHRAQSPSPVPDLPPSQPSTRSYMFFYPNFFQNDRTEYFKKRICIGNIRRCLRGLCTQLQAIRLIRISVLWDT
jgi:hypothetical protein